MRLREIILQGLIGIIKNQTFSTKEKRKQRKQLQNVFNIVVNFFIEDTDN